MGTNREADSLIPRLHAVSATRALREGVDGIKEVRDFPDTFFSLSAPVCGMASFRHKATESDRFSVFSNAHFLSSLNAHALNHSDWESASGWSVFDR